jgi:hypothetical protein
MSWWSGSSAPKDEKPTATMKIDDFSSEDRFQGSESTNFAPSGGMRGGGSSFEQEVMLEQQKVMIQAVMMKLTEASFDTCVTKPSSSLSSTEKSCISATVGKYLDASEIIVGRLQGAQR